MVVNDLLLAALVLVALDDGEGTRVLVILHDEPWNCQSQHTTASHTRMIYSPAKSFLVIAVDLAGLLELGDKLVDGFSVLLGVEVNDESVDHFGGCLMFLLTVW